MGMLPLRLLFVTKTTGPVFERKLYWVLIAVAKIGKSNLLLSTKAFGDINVGNGQRSFGNSP
jgi:hypothetical protein